MDQTDKLYQYKTQFITYMAEVRKVSSTYLKDTKKHLNIFYSFIANNNIDDLNRINKDILVQFQLYLYSEYLLAKHTVRCYLVTLKSFFNYLYLNSLILSNPAINIELIPSPLPQANNRRYYSWQELLTRYKKDHKRKGMTAQDLKQKLFSISLFIKFLNTQGVKTMYKIEPIHIEHYKKFLSAYYNKSDNHIFMKVLRLKQSCRFLKFFYYKGYTQTDPSAGTNYSAYRNELEKESPDKHSAVSKPKSKLDILIERYLIHRISLGYHPRFKTTLNPFKEFLSLRGITDPGQVTKENILEYQNWLSARKYRDNRKYAQNSILNFLCAIIGFYQFLIRYDLLRFDPTAAIDLPKEQDALPRAVMTLREANILLNAPDTSTILGVRDKAVLEVLYSTGMRANEISHLVPEDIDFNQGLVKITHPKGGPSFQRIIAIGAAACHWIKRYADSVRPILLDRNKSSTSYLFLSCRGNQIPSNGFNLITRQYIYKAGLRKCITTHSWRVTCGTFMLRNGADIRYVQEQLGHHSIRSTQRYTRLVPKDLKKAHHKYHPRERGLSVENT